MIEGCSPHHEARCGGGECFGQGRLVPAGPGGPGAMETSTNSQRYELQLIETCGDTWRSPDCDAGTIKNEEVHLCNRR